MRHVQNVDDEVKLAPWRVTKNLINAFKNTGLMQITGPGDPTGRGEGLSFIRVPARTQLSTRDQGNVPRRKGVCLHAVFGRGLATTTLTAGPWGDLRAAVAKTDADLRKLHISELREKLISYGVPEAEVMSLPRWCVRPQRESCG